MFRGLEKFLGRRLVLLGLLLLIGFCNAPQYAMAKECASPPSKINLLFDFNWPDASIVALTRKLSLQCGEPENYMPLIHAIKLHLMNDGIDVANVVLQKDEADAIPQLRIDSTVGASQKKSVVLPVRASPDVTSIIPVFTPKMAKIEAEEIIVSYVTDDMFIRSVGGVVKLQWSRDGAIIPNAKGSRYKLRLADVGKKISAVLRVTVDDRTIAYQKMRAKSPVELAKRPPEIKALVISGDALVGEEVRAKYQFSDMNPEDKEGATQFTWLRGNAAIKNANGPTYVIVPADVGQIISVGVKPKSDDGTTGKSVVASMQDAVDDGLAKFTSGTIDELVLPNDENVETVETLEAIFESVLDDLSLPSLPTEARLYNQDEVKNSLVSVQYITPELRLAPSSPTQFIGFRHGPSKLLSNRVLNRITFKLIGRPIDIVLLSDAIELVNKAYADAGFKLSYASIPRQIINGGLIEIRLMEAADMHHHF